MSWSFFSCVTIAVLLITWFEWPKLKQKPKKDKVAFISLLLIVWLLSMLDLPNTPGPTTVLHFIFKPFKGLLEQ
jgi:Na+/melibiose symporter-like transporter